MTTGARQDLAASDDVAPATEEKLSPELRFLELLNAEDGPPPEEKAAPGEQEVVETTEAVEEVEEETVAETSEEAEEEPSEEVQETEDTEDTEVAYEVKVGDEVLAIPVSKLIQRYGEEKNYTQRAQALATERKAFDTQQAEVISQRDYYGQMLGQLQKVMEQTGPTEPSKELRESNPGEYAAQMADFQKQTNELRSVQDEQARVHEQNVLEFQQERKKRLAVEQERLHERVPEWRDAEKYQKGSQDVTKYLMGVYEYTVDDLNTLDDHRPIDIARKAMLYDQLQKTKPSLVKKARTVKTVKPGGAKTLTKHAKSDTQARREALRQSGSKKDAAAVFLDMLNAED